MLILASVPCRSGAYATSQCGHDALGSSNTPRASSPRYTDPEAWEKKGLICRLLGALWPTDEVPDPRVLRGVEGLRWLVCVCVCVHMGRQTPCVTVNEDRKPIERRKVLCHQVVELRGGLGPQALMEPVSAEADVVLIAVCLYLYI